MNATIVPTLQRPDVPWLLPIGRATENGHTGVSESRTIEPNTRVVEIVDRSQWNALVLGRPNYDLVQGWEWGDVQRNEGWTPHRYAMHVGAECVAAVSVARRRLPGLRTRSSCVPRPLLDWEDGVRGAASRIVRSS